MLSPRSTRRHVFHTSCLTATGLVTLLAGARSARAADVTVPIVGVEGGVSSSRSLPGTLQLRAGWVHTSDEPTLQIGAAKMYLGGDLSLRLGAGGPRVAPLFRATFGKDAVLGFGFAAEAGPSFRLGSQVRPGAMVQLVGGFYGLHTSLWAEQAGAQRAVGVTAGIDLVHALIGAYALSHHNVRG